LFEKNKWNVINYDRANINMYADVNAFTSPMDQYHVQPNYMPFTINLGGLPANAASNMESFADKPWRSKGRSREGMTSEAADYLTRMNTAMNSNNSIKSTPYIMDPQSVSDLEYKNRDLSGAQHRFVGQYLPEDALADQIRREINRIEFQSAEAPRTRNVGFDHEYGDRFPSTVPYKDAMRDLYYNSDGRSSGLSASFSEMAYGFGRGKIPTSYEAYHKFSDGSDGRPAGSIEGLSDRHEGMRSGMCGCSGNKSGKKSKEGFCGGGCKCKEGCKCIKCKSYEYLRGYQEGMREGVRTTGISGGSGANFLSDDAFGMPMWMFFIIIVAVCFGGFRLVQFYKRRKTAAEETSETTPLNDAET
jgi:hypothetical protein